MRSLPPTRHLFTFEIPCTTVVLLLSLEYNIGNTGFSLHFSARSRNPDGVLAIYMRPLHLVAETLLAENDQNHEKDALLHQKSYPLIAIPKPFP